MRWASLCLDPIAPYHIVVLVSSESVEAQVSALVDTNGGPLVGSAVVTVIGAAAKGTAFAVLRYASCSKPPRVVANGTADSHEAVAEAAVAAASGGDGRLLETLRRNAPHAVLPLPPGAALTGSNVRGLCYFDAVVNDESEATAAYPFARPFTAAGGARVTVGLLLSDGDGAVVVSSCRPPRALGPAADRTIDGRHYTQGGDMVMRGALWCLDVGSALSRRAGGSPADLPPRSVLVPYLAGVHEDAVLHRLGRDRRVGNDVGKCQLTNGERMGLFPHVRKVVDSHCSADPSNPVRVVSYVAAFVDLQRLRHPRNSFDILLRTLNATALMTGYSDIVVATNVGVMDILNILLAEAERRSPTDIYYGTHTRVAVSLARSLLFPNPLGELVVVSYRETPHLSPSDNNMRWHTLVGHAHTLLISQLGFHDIVRYTEDDVHITRDQFELYCAVMPLLEQRDQHFNFLRFEARWDDLDEAEASTNPQVETSLIPNEHSSKATIVPRRRTTADYFHKRIYMNVVQRRAVPLQRYWSDKAIYGDNVTLLKDCHVANSKIFGVFPPFDEDDRVSFAISLRLESEDDKEDHNYTVDITGAVNPPRALSSVTSRFAAALPVPRTVQRYKVNEVSLQDCRFVGPSSSTQHTLSNKLLSSRLDGCYTLTPANHKDFSSKEIYSAMVMGPTHRYQNHYLRGWRGWSHHNNDTRSIFFRSNLWRGSHRYFNFTAESMPWQRALFRSYRESFVYFGMNVRASYRNGGVFPVYIEEEEGLAARRDTHDIVEESCDGYSLPANPPCPLTFDINGRNASLLPRRRFYHQPYGVHRLAAINHGPNREPNTVGLNIEYPSYVGILIPINC